MTISYLSPSSYKFTVDFMAASFLSSHLTSRLFQICICNGASMNFRAGIL